MKRIDSKKQLFPYIFVLIFAVCSSLALFMNGDDYLWFYSVEDHDLDKWQTPNGRFFSNKVTIWLVRSFSFRTIFIALTFALFLIIMAKIFDLRNFLGSSKYYLTTIFFIFIPHATYSETVNWISGYTNYVFSMLMVFIYILFMFRCIFDKYAPKPYTSVFFFFIALVGGLCVEHVTIYNALLAFTLLILAFRMNIKSIPHAVAFLIGAAISCFLMFGNGIYSDIYSKGDDIGKRSFEVGFANIIQNAYSFIVVHYTKDFWLMPIVITIAFTILYLKKEFGEKIPKYLKSCMMICWLYSSYSIYTMCISDLRVFTPQMRTVALEAAFAFLYIVAIAYLVWVFLEKNSKIRAYIYLVSTLLLTGPFLFISPATARCFFANYMFWILFCGEVLTSAVKTIDEKNREKIRGFVFAFSFCSVFLILTACLTNKFINTLRFDYIKEQLNDEKSRKVDLLLLPYTEYNHDDLNDGLLNAGEGSDDFTYSKYILKYYGIETDPSQNYVESKVSAYNYFIQKDEY